MKRIRNTTNDTITVQIFGQEYTLLPLGFLDVEETVCDYWRNNLHEFLIEEAIPKKEVKEVKEVVETVSEVNTKTK